MPEARDIAFADLAVGDSRSFTASITPQTTEDFAALSGDLNPLHTDDAYAKTTAFGHILPHGMIAGGLFSRLVGMELPGRRALYLSQTLAFQLPLPVDGNVLVKGEVLSKSESTRTIRIATTVCDAATDILLVRGEAQVRVLE